METSSLHYTHTKYSMLAENTRRRYSPEILAAGTRIKYSGRRQLKASNISCITDQSIGWSKQWRTNHCQIHTADSHNKPNVGLGLIINFPKLFPQQTPTSKLPCPFPKVVVKAAIDWADNTFLPLFTMRGVKSLDRSPGRETSSAFGQACYIAGTRSRPLDHRGSPVLENLESVRQNLSSFLIKCNGCKHM
jgi:hypothetical protein